MAIAPPILYGTAWKKDDTARLVASALRCGFRGIDTACQPKHYNEAGVGAGIAAALGDGLERKQLYVQSKFTSISGQDPASIPYDAQAPLREQVSQSVAVSLHNLRTDYLDCLILHSPLATTQRTLEAWSAMESHVAPGKVRQLGLSNCYRLELLRMIHDAARVKPAVLQNRFYADTGYDAELRIFCRERKIRYQSFWTLTANPHLLSQPVLLSLAARHARTPAQILLRFLTQIGITPLTGTRSEIHMREDLEIMEFELAEPDVASMSALIEPR